MIYAFGILLVGSLMSIASRAGFRTPRQLHAELLQRRCGCGHHVHEHGPACTREIRYVDSTTVCSCARWLPLALIALVGCMADAAPLRGGLVVEDVYPEMVDAAAPAWAARYGMACDASRVRLVFAHGAELARLCPPNTGGCTPVRAGEPRRVVVDDSEPDAVVHNIIAHELGHVCAARTGIDSRGDVEHAHASIWAEGGFQYELAAAP